VDVVGAPAARVGRDGRRGGAVRKGDAATGMASGAREGRGRGRDRDGRARCRVRGVGGGPAGRRRRRWRRWRAGARQPPVAAVPAHLGVCQGPAGRGHPLCERGRAGGTPLRLGDPTPWLLRALAETPGGQSALRGLTDLHTPRRNVGDTPPTQSAGLPATRSVVVAAAGGRLRTL